MLAVMIIVGDEPLDAVVKNARQEVVLQQDAPIIGMWQNNGIKLLKLNNTSILKHRPYLSPRVNR